jgi:hypothetical protein
MKRFALTTLLGTAALVLAACSSTESDTTAVELSAGEGDAMMSCLAFDTTFLAEMPIAFEGTATAVGDDRVTLDVERWFKGGEADEVTLVAPAGLEALIAGIDFQEGTSYLISASDGSVNYCGYSGEATPELTAGFEAAFAD